MTTSEQSAFDESAYLDSTTSEAGSTVLTPIPAAEYVATIEELKVRPWQSKKDPNKSGVSVDIVYKLQDDNGKIAETIGRPAFLTQGYFMDLDKNNKFDYGKGKNIQLMRVRDACGQNIGGQVWTPRHLLGQALRVNVVEEPDKTPGSDVVFNRVKSVGSLNG